MKYDHVKRNSTQQHPVPPPKKKPRKKEGGGNKKMKHKKTKKKTDLMLPEIVVPIRGSTAEGRPVQTHVRPQLPAQLRPVERIVRVAKRWIAVGLGEIRPQTVC